MAKKQDGNEVSGWVGWVFFAAFMMVFIGFFQMLQGLTAVLKDTYYVVLPQWIVSVNLSVWGWIHMVIGGVLLCAGLALFSGKDWARAIGVVFVGFSMLANLLFIAAYPLWSVVVIALDVFVAYALIVHGNEAKNL